jgi:hypothetical protein
MLCGLSMSMLLSYLLGACGIASSVASCHVPQVSRCLFAPVLVSWTRLFEIWKVLFDSMLPCHSRCTAEMVEV